jgi:hypothetical protein
MPNHTPDDQSPKRSALDRFLSGIAESIFLGRLGIVDVQMVDYISDMLLRFIRLDGMHRVRRGTGEPATEVFQMLIEGQKRIGLARREVHRHIGDFTLFWSGVYPESLRQVAGVDSPDSFLSYCQQGKRAYQIAAEIEGGENRPSSELLHRLSEQFDMCAYGLREIRRSWEEETDQDGSAGLLLG